jgi:hypothetical protein
MKADISSKSDLPLPENPNKTKKNKSKRKEILRSSRPGSEGPNGLVQKRKTTGMPKS